MSSKNNVNPDYYKTGGSLRQGEAVLHNQEKKEYTQSRSDLEEENFIPGALPPTVPPERPKTARNVKRRRAGKS